MSVPAHYLTNPAAQPPMQPLAPAPAPAQHLPPNVLATGTPGVTIPAQQAALPTEEQMRNPYNIQTDPTRAGSPEQHFNEQRAPNPADAGARIAAARLETTVRMAQERNQHLEQQLLQSQQANQQQFTAIQQQIATANAPPAVDPLAQYDLTPEERELAGDQLGVVQKIAARMAREAELRNTTATDIRIGEIEQRFKDQLAPIEAASAQTAQQIQQDWGNQFVANVQNEMGFDVRALQGDPAWDAFATSIVPFSGGITFGAQLANFITARDTNSAMELTRSFAATRQANAQMVNPAAHSPAPHQPDTRPSALAPVVVDPAAQRLADTQEFSRLTDQLSRGTLSIPDFHRLTKPIDDRLAGRTT